MPLFDRASAPVETSPVEAGARPHRRARRLLLFCVAAISTALAVRASLTTGEADSLCQADRQYLWDVEHVAFVMEQKAFPLLKKALVAADGETLKSFLAEDFRGELPFDDWSTAYADSRIAIRKKSLEGGRVRTVEAGALVDELLSWRRLLDEGREGCQAEIGLVRLSPVDRNDLHGPWTGLWRVRLAGKSQGRLTEVSFRLRLQIGPLDEDLATRRRWIRAARVESAQTAQAEEPLLADVTARSGIETRRMYDNWMAAEKQLGGTGGIYLLDYDRDGRLDALVNDIAAGILLYRGTGDGRFVDVTGDSDLPRVSPTGRNGELTPSVADLDGDGDEDVLLGRYVYENLGNGRFRDVTGKCNLRIQGAAAIVAADYDHDGRIDLYETHTHAPSYRQPSKRPDKVAWIDGGWGYKNVLWRNLGDWQFEDATDKAGAGGNGGSAFTAVWLDANNDRWADVLSINEFGRNALLINQRDGTFRQIEDIDPVFGGFSMGAAAGDYDNDGNMDLYVSNMYSKAGNRVLSNVDPAAYPPALYAKITEATVGSKLYRGLGDGRFEVAPPEKALREIGWSFGPAFVDLNGDGLCDVYSTAGYVSYERGKPDG
ncbi:MAG: VCBS repeat-containing protein [Planctomycetia bacterium]|nr:VCBS repeat-containing protein [Planctomycetia bacterium]